MRSLRVQIAALLSMGIPVAAICRRWPVPRRTVILIGKAAGLRYVPGWDAFSTSATWPPGWDQ